MKTIKTYDTFTKTYTTVEVDDEIANAMELFDALEKEDDIAFWKAQKSAKKPWYFKNYQEADYVGDVIKEFLEDNSIEDLQAMAPETIDLIVDMLFPDVDPINLQDASEVYANRRKTWSTTYIDEFIPRSKSKAEIIAKVGKDNYTFDKNKRRFAFGKPSESKCTYNPDEFLQAGALEAYNRCCELKEDAIGIATIAKLSTDIETIAVAYVAYKRAVNELKYAYKQFEEANATQDTFIFSIEASHDIPRNEQYEDYSEHADWEWEKLMSFRESEKERYAANTWTEGRKALAREKRLNDYRGLVNPPRFIKLDANDMIIRKKEYTFEQFAAGIKKLERQRIEENCKHRRNIIPYDKIDGLDSWFKAMQVK